MDLIYSVGTTPISSRKSKNAANVERALGAENLCQISSGNVIAFSASGGPEEGLNVAARGYHVFVADLNTPWDIHLVWSGSSPVTCLEWDAAGTRLLLGHADGLLQLLQSPAHVINSWHCLHSVRADNEHIVQAIFFHNGKKISIASEKKDSFLYNDKFQNTLFCPTLRHFGGRPTDGFIGLTSSGLLAVCALNGNGSEATFKKFELSKRRSFVKFASMAYSKNGDVLVACSAGLPDAPVTCHQVSLRQTLSELCADVQQLPSVYLDCGAQADSGMQAVACVRHLHKEDASQLLVAAAGDGGGVLELWQLGEVPVSFGQIFKHFSGSEPRVQTWLKSASYQSQRPLSSVDTARVCLQDGGLPAPPIVATTADGGIVSLHRDTMAQMAMGCAEPAPRPAGEPPLKLARSAAAAAAAADAGVRLTDVALTSAGHLAAAVDDRGQLYLYRVGAAADPGGLSVVSSLVLQLEYYMVTGLDVWDLLVGLRFHLSGGLESVCETLADTFHRQPGPVQQYYYVRHMAIKTSLYRLLPSGSRRVTDNNALLMLRCVASAFRALLRPTESSLSTSGGDGEPSESLTAFMASNLATEIDKVLLAHPKEGDPGSADAASLAQLQHLAQWVADLCLQSIAALTDGRHKQVAVLRERQSLLLLRELLVMIRRWGAVRPACLPVFHRGGEHTDVIALLFKLLTKLLGMHSAEPDEALINEFSLLPSPGLAEHWSLDLPARGVLAVSATGASTAVRHYCFYDSEGAESPTSHRRHQDNYTVDALRYLRLGARPSSLKQCTRCLAVTSARSSEQLSQVKSTPVTRAWDQRWTRACLCGGHWALQGPRLTGRARAA
ncbi:mediator of RNA polymerase II transcription subunit 16-like [Amphibalanus amphitrite]|uniref:mediator of RNA polymerase II transcription subunit 16-like n=1 Tax=Amphibalanus amphitrite TaxID=1232801 RepID=UPI001C923FA4|nr:mediator of RNA polymerase II transcription subunit 16-like [Amphibalanus amphitrite]